MKKAVLVLIFLLGSEVINGQELIDSLPIDLRDDLIFIELSVNDDPRSLKFLFDTGAGVTVVDTQVAQLLQLSTSGSLPIMTSGKTVRSERSENNNVSLGERLILDSITLFVMDISHLSDYYKFQIDGVIGYDLLARVVTETDMDSGQMRFYTSDAYVYPGSAQGIPFSPLDSDTFGLPLAVVPKGRKDTLDLVVKIDTGADNHLTFFNSTVTGHHLMEAGKRYKEKRGFGAEPTVTIDRAGKVTSVVFGTKKWRNIPVVFQVDPINSAPKERCDGLIGQKMLVAFNITYDLAGGVVYSEQRR